MQFVVQNWYLFIALLVVLAMLAYGPLRQLMAGVQKISTPEAVRLVNHEKAVIVDVREPDEYRSGHIPNAINVPLSGFAGSLGQLEKYKSRPVIICCRTSQRSARAAIALRQKQFANVQVLAGGIVGWQGDSLPVEK
jgi:rhodanese-related sulfurtransferase